MGHPSHPDTAERRALFLHLPPWPPPLASCSAWRPVTSTWSRLSPARRTASSSPPRRRRRGRARSGRDAAAPAARRARACRPPASRYAPGRGGVGGGVEALVCACVPGATRQFTGAVRAGRWGAGAARGRHRLRSSRLPSHPSAAPLAHPTASPSPPSLSPFCPPAPPGGRPTPGHPGRGSRRGRSVLGAGGAGVPRAGSGTGRGVAGRGRGAGVRGNNFTIVPALQPPLQGVSGESKRLKRRPPPWTVERPSARHALACTPM